MNEFVLRLGGNSGLRKNSSIIIVKEGIVGRGEAAYEISAARVLGRLSTLGAD